MLCVSQFTKKLHKIMLKNNAKQFNNTNEFFNYLINEYLKINQINIDNLKSYVNAYEQITKTHNENDILHIILYNDLFCVYEKNNVAYEYLFYNNHIIYDCNEKYDSYDDYLYLNELFIDNEKK